MSRSIDSSRDADWYACPFCGAEVRVGPDGCPRCTTGKPRKQPAYLDGVDLPDDPEDFDYDDFVKREFGGGASSVKPAGLKWIWWVTGVLLVGGMVAGIVFRVIEMIRG